MTQNVPGYYIDKPVASSRPGTNPVAPTLQVYIDGRRYLTSWLFSLDLFLDKLVTTELRPR